MQSELLEEKLTFLNCHDTSLVFLKMGVQNLDFSE